jgi:hypothetical protein
LCCVVRLRACVCILFCLCLPLSCISMFAAFERVFCLPSITCLSIQCKLMRRLRAGNFWQCAVCEYALRCCVLFVSLMKLIFGPRDSAPLLWRVVSTLRSPGILSEATCVTLSRFCLAPSLLGASLFLERFCLHASMILT